MLFLVVYLMKYQEFNTQKWAGCPMILPITEKEVGLVIITQMILELFILILLTENTNIENIIFKM